jgi:hypothetical protein
MGPDEAVYVGEYPTIPDLAITVSLSLAVWLTDSTTGKIPGGRIRVGIREGDRLAVLNRDGYHLFVQLDPGRYRLFVDSDLYQPVEQEVDLPFPAGVTPLLSVALTPGTG